MWDDLRQIMADEVRDKHPDMAAALIATKLPHDPHKRIGALIAGLRLVVNNDKG